MENREINELSYPLFDGETFHENASVSIKDGVITAVRETECANTGYFLMPGLIDGHTHINTPCQVEAMVKNGVTAACDVAASRALIDRSERFAFISSAGMTMGTLNGKAYVDRALANGADYIKVLLTEPSLMLKSVLADICARSHEKGVKVAVHAVSVKAVQLAVSCGADILLHVPMKETFPEELAISIAEKGIFVAPTLVMMHAFSKSGRNGYKPEHYQNAENAVRLLRRCGVRILTATDANDGSFAPPVDYGVSMHRELELLVRAGMTPCEALAGATRLVAEAFGIASFGTVRQGQKANLLLIQGSPNKNISDTAKIKQVIINGEPVL